MLNLLLKHPKADTFTITAPVRSPAKADLLEKLGVKTTIASLDEPDKLVALASAADVVFNVVSVTSLLLAVTVGASTDRHRIDRRVRTTCPAPELS